MRLRTIVLGLLGVGKATVVERASEILGAKVVTFGTVMFEEARKLGWVKNRDEMREMPVERQKRLQRFAAAKISRASGRIPIVDTHLSIRAAEGEGWRNRSLGTGPLLP